MELDTNYKKDFPFLSENRSNTPFKSCFENGLFSVSEGSSTFSSSESSLSPSKGFLQNFIISNQNQNQHLTLDVNNAPLLDPQNFHQIPADESTKNPSFGVSLTCNERYKTTGVFPTDLNYAHVPNLPFEQLDGATFATNENNLFQGFQQPQDGFLDFQYQYPQMAAAKLIDQNNEYDENQMFFQSNKPLSGIKDLNKNDIIKGQWTHTEDSSLISLVAIHGTKKWSLIAEQLGGRVGKQCRERWHNHLRPNIKKDSWSEEEEMTLIEAHKEIGNKWAEIAKRLPGRTENNIKNYWNAAKRRQYARSRLYSPKGDLLHNYIKSLSIAGIAPTTTPTPTHDDQNNPMSWQLLVAGDDDHHHQPMMNPFSFDKNDLYNNPQMSCTSGANTFSSMLQEIDPSVVEEGHVHDDQSKAMGFEIDPIMDMHSPKEVDFQDMISPVAAASGAENRNDFYGFGPK